MSAKSYEIRASDLPAPILDRIKNAVTGFSTPLIKFSCGADQKPKTQLIGCGTFVSIEGIRGIVTAQHVAQEMDLSSETGIILMEAEHRFSVKNQYLKIISLADSITPGNGPDLAFIKLPTPIVAQISPYKSFFNLSFNRNELLCKPPGLHDGLWVAYGSPDEWIKTETSTSRPGNTLSVCSYCSVGGLNIQYEKNGYDYSEVDIDYKISGSIPQSLGGFSGGGLWQITLKGTSFDKPEPAQYFFSGAAFYQSELTDHRRMLRCHGRMSIYNSLYNKVIENTA